MSFDGHFGPVRFERLNDACRITLDRPERGNALRADLVEGLLAALDAVEATDSATVLLEGSGKGFCGGFDLGGLDAETDASLLHRFVRIETLLQRVATFPRRTVVYAQGFAFGAGADLLAACDMRIAAPDCRLSFPGARFGIVLGTRRLSARLGADAALKLIEAPGPVRAANAGALLTDFLAPDDWPAERARILSSPSSDRGILAALLECVRPKMDADADLADLVRSAARPGLHARLAAYAATTQVVRKTENWKKN